MDIHDFSKIATPIGIFIGIYLGQSHFAKKKITLGKGKLLDKLYLLFLACIFFLIWIMLCSIPVIFFTEKKYLLVLISVIPLGLSAFYYLKYLRKKLIKLEES